VLYGEVSKVENQVEKYDSFVQLEQLEEEFCRPVVKIIAEYLSQHDEKHVVPTPLSVGKG
jgi:hypothetical protein